MEQTVQFRASVATILTLLSASWRQDVIQKASKLNSRDDLNRIWGRLSAKRAPKELNPKKDDHFPEKCEKNIVNNTKNEPAGILNRIYRIRPKRNIRSRTDPGFPTPGARITVVYTNSLKLPEHETPNRIV